MMRIRMPSRKVCREFHLTYELKGAQGGVDVLTGYYRIGRMKIVLDGRRVGNGYSAIYYRNKAYFTKKGLNKRNVLHELYHHIVDVNGLEITGSDEEREANRFVREVLSKVRG